MVRSHYQNDLQETPEEDLVSKHNIEVAHTLFMSIYTLVVKLQRRLNEFVEESPNKLDHQRLLTTVKTQFQTAGLFQHREPSNATDIVKRFESLKEKPELLRQLIERYDESVGDTTAGRMGRQIDSLLFGTVENISDMECNVSGGDEVTNLFDVALSVHNRLSNLR